MLPFDRQTDRFSYRVSSSQRRGADTDRSSRGNSRWFQVKYTLRREELPLPLPPVPHRRTNLRNKYSLPQNTRLVNRPSCLVKINFISTDEIARLMLQSRTRDEAGKIDRISVKSDIRPSVTTASPERGGINGVRKRRDISRRGWEAASNTCRVKIRSCRGKKSRYRVS